MRLLTMIPELLSKGIPEIENIIDKLPNHPSKVYSTRSMDSCDTWVFHHTASEAPLINQAKYHVNGNGWARIGYTFVIADNRIYQTNYLDVQATHCAGYNDRSLGVAVLGDLSKRSLTDRERELISALFACLNRAFPGRAIKGHNECGVKTACPCTSMERIRESVGDLELILSVQDTPNAQMAKIFDLNVRFLDIYKRAVDPKDKYHAEAMRKMLEAHAMWVERGVL